MMSKEKINGSALYLGIIILIVGVFYVSYYVGSYFRDNDSDIPVGQEYSIKDIKGSNSSFIIVYYDNDKNRTERAIIQSGYNIFNFTVGMFIYRRNKSDKLLMKKLLNIMIMTRSIQKKL